MGLRKKAPFLTDTFTFGNDGRYYALTSGCLADGLKGGFMCYHMQISQDGYLREIESVSSR